MARDAATHTYQWARWATLPVCLMLWGCPEADKTANGTAAGGQAPTSVTTSAQAASAATTTYRGTLSFGGTIAITLDEPTAGMATIRFDDSPFGISGSIVGKVTTRLLDGRRVVSGLKADGANPPPDALVDAIQDVSLAFTAADGLLVGDIEGLPNVAMKAAVPPRRTGGHPGNPSLAGTIHATGTVALPAVASIAGTYSYVAESSQYKPGAVIPELGTQSAEAGQLRIDADGNIVTCPGQPFQSQCKSLRAGEPVQVLRLRTADQTRYPGMFDVMAGDVPFGKLFLQERNGERLLFMTQRFDLPSHRTLGTWVVRSTAPLAPGKLNGNWSCRQPRATLDMLNPPALTGAVGAHGLTVKDETIDADIGQGVDFGKLALNAGFGADEGSPARIGGLARAGWSETPAPAGEGDMREQVIVPLDDQRFVYLAETDVDSEGVTWGSCTRSVATLLQ